MYEHKLNENLRNEHIELHSTTTQQRAIFTSSKPYYIYIPTPSHPNQGIKARGHRGGHFLALLETFPSYMYFIYFCKYCFKTILVVGDKHSCINIDVCCFCFSKKGKVSPKYENIFIKVFGRFQTYLKRVIY